jgi:hypothetical protein
MINFKKDGLYNSCEIALKRIREVISNPKIKVIALTATPRKATAFFDGKVKYIDIENNVKHPITGDSIPYTNIDYLLDSMRIAANEKGIIYTRTINEMKRIHSILTQKGVKAIPIWSESTESIENIMTDEQLRVRKHIIEHKEIPLEYDTIIINYAYQTGITINNNLDFIIVHSQKNDVKTQIRERCIGDVKQLYYYSNNENSVINIPHSFIGRELFKEDTTALCNILKLRNKQGNIVAWTTTKKRLENSGYIITQGKRGTRHYYKIEMTDNKKHGFI